MRRKRIEIAGAAAAAAWLVVALSGCGGLGDASAIVRVGDRSISVTIVGHWADVVARGGSFTGFRGEPETGTPRQRALGLLITCNWLIGEARREGLSIPRRLVSDAIAERTHGQAASEFRARQTATGQTLAGVELELKAELALEAIRQALSRRINDINEHEVATFYRENAATFEESLETRDVNIIEHIPSEAAAKALIRRIGTGRRFAQIAYHKKLRPTPGVLSGPAHKKAVDRAIFAARVNVVSAPMRLNAGWSVFIVRRIVPARLEPLAKVRAVAREDLLRRRKREITNGFEEEFRRRWTAKTICRSGYVVLGCAEYHGPAPRYQAPLFSES